MLHETVLIMSLGLRYGGPDMDWHQKLLKEKIHHKTHYALMQCTRYMWAVKPLHITCKTCVGGCQHVVCPALRSVTHTKLCGVCKHLQSRLDATTNVDRLVHRSHSSSQHTTVCAVEVLHIKGLKSIPYLDIPHLLYKLSHTPQL